VTTPINAWSAAASSGTVALAAGARGMTTKSTPAGSACRCHWHASRTLRLRRFLRTARPNCLPTENPTRGPTRSLRRA